MSPTLGSKSARCHLNHCPHHCPPQSAKAQELAALRPTKLTTISSAMQIRKRAASVEAQSWLCTSQDMLPSAHFMQFSLQRPPISHANVSNFTFPSASAASRYLLVLRFSATSKAAPAVTAHLGCGIPFWSRGETCVTSQSNGGPNFKLYTANSTLLIYTDPHVSQFLVRHQRAPCLVKNLHPNFLQYICAPLYST